MRISIIHPTRGRKQIALSTANKWLSNADNLSNIEYLLSTDIEDVETYSNVLVFFGYSSKEYNVVPIRNNNHSAIEAINNAAKVARCDILLVVSDDTDCPEHWDTLLLNALKGKSDFCAKTNDGLQSTLITMPIMDRVYYERYGYVYHPDYQHMFCDQELTAVAIMTGKYIKLDLSFPHMHYSAGLSIKDEVNVKNDLTWCQGETLFNERLKTNFGIDRVVVPYSDIKWR